MFSPVQIRYPPQNTDCIESVAMNIPWWAKIGVKIVLSRLPVSNQFWRALGVFKHGAMDTPRYALEVFQSHFQTLPKSLLAPGFTCLELGPGDSLASGLIACAFGATKTYLVDVGPFATGDASVYREHRDFLLQNDLKIPEVTGHSLEEISKQFNITYLTDGLKSLESIPDDSIDFVWSHAVLEHVRKAEFTAVQKQLRRILRPTGLASHQVDLRDHLEGGLHHRRFSERVWESPLFADSGFYTNRLSCEEILQSFAEVGFHIKEVHKHRWDALPIERKRLAPAYQSIPDDELRIWEFRVSLESPNSDGERTE
jgi:SAM-dependent methyltransferase